MKRIPLNRGWDFTRQPLGEGPADFCARVDLPHDFVITMPRRADAAGGGSNGFFPDACGTYRKTLPIPGEWAGLRVLLAIDGAYMNAEVSLNGEHLCAHPYGYTAFFADLSEAMKPGKDNALVISTQSRQPATRWYAGGGLYRDVSLWVGPKDGIRPWDVFVTTDKDGDGAIVDVAVDGDAEIELTDQDGEKVAAGGKRLRVARPRLWDTDDPHLYVATIRKMQNGREIDRHEQTFGIRTIEMDAANGFRLNGRPMKLRGGCIHHDNGPLGAAAHPRAEARKIELLKKLGYTAIRSSHYPPSSALLDACDRLGMLVLDEAFDAWTIGKKPLDYHLYFRDWWERDTESMVLRDRNHPCVFAYSIGNEIEERDANAEGVRWAQKLAEKVRSLDPTRPVTSALNNIFPKTPDPPENPFAQTHNWIERQHLENGDLFAEHTEPFVKALDIAGYNYLVTRYALDRVKYPDRVIIGTETFAANTYDYWKATLENPNVIGDFLWTAVDYLGEAGLGRCVWEDRPDTRDARYPWALANDADIDLISNRRAQSYYREILWGLASGPALMTMHPDRHGVRWSGWGWQWQDVHPCWNFDDAWIGRPVDVFVYADADEVEFALNGVSLGLSPVEKLTAHRVIPYRPGTLSATAIRGGQAVGSAALETAGAPCAILLTPDRDTVAPDGDLCFVAVSIVDARGRIVPDKDRTLFVSVAGEGTLAALGNADPFAEQAYGLPERDTYRGRALAVLRSAECAGTVRLTVSAPGLPSACVTATVR